MINLFVEVKCYQGVRHHVDLTNFIKTGGPTRITFADCIDCKGYGGKQNPPVATLLKDDPDQFVISCLGNIRKTSLSLKYKPRF